MTSQFDVATATELVTVEEDRTIARIDLSDQWAIGDKPHGGFLLGVLADAARRTLEARSVEHPHPLTTSTIFLRPPGFAPTEVVTEVRRSGRTISHLHTTLLQEGRPCVESLLTFGTATGDAPALFSDDPMPALPPYDECVEVPRRPTLPDGTPFRIGIAEVTTMRMPVERMASLAPGAAGAPVPHAPATAEITGWLGFSDGRDQDAASLLFVLDALPPVTFTLGIPGWVPTLELTTYLRGLPAPGPVLVRQRGRLIQDGRLDEVCDVWDATGRLVAQATQLAAVRLPG